ncbi:MAG: UDP-N-acetylmuramate--L-alanine ligase [Gemmatimonadota bacterium]|nr:UDP-N-acetylmuramate--L-alanine ligase [Gemmatimonadota bacterium]
MTAAEHDLRQLAARGPIHFVGIGGAGMCALAELLARKGVTVSGCDVKRSPTFRVLEELGVSLHVGHAPDHVDGVAALVVTSAVPADHPELTRARSLGIPVLKRAEALGSWVDSGTVVGVAGTHGKTTTTAMTTEILVAAGREPTGLVGGRVTGWAGNLRAGSDALFVVEADEYDRSFLTLRPDVAVITNVEADHLDVYGDLEGVREGFRAFLRGVKNGGRIVVCADDHGAASVLPEFAASGYTYGTKAGAMLRAYDVEAREGRIRCRVTEDGVDRGVLELPVPGRHNLLNALGAAAAARGLGVPWSPIVDALAGFSGVGRRFERLGTVGGVTVIDDYAHHPTEIAATVEGIRGAFPGRRLVAAFQPHLYSRTRDFAREFGRALAGADEIWVTDVFPAREEPIPGVSGETVVDAARAAGAAAVHSHPRLETLAATLASTLREGDVLVTMGAGSIEDSGRQVLEHLKEGAHA